MATVRVQPWGSGFCSRMVVAPLHRPAPALGCLSWAARPGHWLDKAFS